jgi:hypothetical protein
MATLTFRVGDLIFFICYLKNHITFFWDFRSKLFGNYFEKNQIIQSKLKSGNLRLKNFLFENYEVAKSFQSRQKKLKKCKSVKKH